jgi:predicted amidohydrolase
MIAAVAQIDSQPDRAANLARCEDVFASAAEREADLLVLPENVLYRGLEEGFRASASRMPGPVTELLGELSRRTGVAAVWGGVVEETDAGRYNAALLFDREGVLQARYRKMHLFALYDGDVTRFEEHSLFEHGTELVVAPLFDHVLGLSICYDLRFPELYRELVARGADVLLVPSDFTRRTGQAHWLPLLQARAIENLCYVLAANQCGENQSTGALSHGHSCIIDPWGEVVAECDGEHEGLAVAEVSMEVVESARARIRALEHRRL